MLGLSWLETHNPTVDWCNRSITFPVRPIPTRPRHSLDSIVVESGLVNTLAIVSRDVTVPINNLPARHSDFSNIFEKRNVDWGYRLITPMIAQLSSKQVSTPHLVLSMGYLNLNLTLSAHIWPRISRKASFNPPNPRSGYQSYLSKSRTAPYAYV